jgi:hypothetical protein
MLLALRRAREREDITYCVLFIHVSLNMGIVELLTKLIENYREKINEE